MSRPMNTPPQWPFPDPSASVALANTGPSQSTPAARFQPELKKTPNPIRAPPTLNQYQPQDPTSFFSAHSSFAVSPQDSMDGYDTMSPAQASSRRTTSSVGSIPDFPLPAITSVPTPPRRSGILGPPPSSRRGLSTMYSSASLVSPIPEESPRSRSRGSYASSAAMPETWGTSSSPLASPGDSAAFFDDSSSERSRDSTLDDFEFLDEPKLDRSDSRGEAGKADFVKTASANNMLNPFEDGAGYVDASRYIDTSTSDLTAFPLAKPDPAASLSNLSQTGELTPDAILRAYAAASLSNPSGVQAGAGPSSDTRVPPSVMSAIRAADERSSLTSLPDLIRRATRLVSMIDKGRRPGSRIDDLSAWGSSDNTGSRDGDGSLSVILIVILILGIVAVAIVVPLEFFVFRNLGNKSAQGRPDRSIENCREFLTCLNGGTNVISPGTCSCICTNGFTGSDCAVGGSQGCTTTNLVNADGSSNVKNVTLGRSIPRLIAGADSNFSVPLAGMVLLAKLNAASLSCNAQNSLVTFEGRSTKASGTSNVVAEAGLDTGVVLSNARKKEEEYYPLLPTIILIPPRPRPPRYPDDDPPPRPPRYPDDDPPRARPTTRDPIPVATSPPRSESTTRRSTTSPVQTTRVPPRDATTSPTSAPTRPVPAPMGSFVITEDVLDFARVAVLFITQEQNKDNAETAQTALRNFFSRANRNQLEVQEARRLPIGGANRIDLVDFSIDIGNGPIGRKNFKRRIGEPI